MEAADAAPVEEMSYLQMEPAGDGDNVEASYLEMTPDAVIEEGDDVGAYLEMAAVSYSFRFLKRDTAKPIGLGAANPYLPHL